MASLTTYAEGRLALFFQGTAITPPAAWYATLFTVTPTKAGGGTELTTNGFTRISFAFGSTTPGTPDGTKLGNASQILFPSTTPAANTGIVAWGIMDASSSGNLWIFGPTLDGAGSPATLTANINDQLRFLAGQLYTRFT